MEKMIELELKADKTKIAVDAETERIFEIMVKAPHKESEKQRTAMNLALVIDRSGSMSGGKLEYAKKAACHVVSMLDENDYLTLVSFDDEVTVHAAAVKMEAGVKAELVSSISRMEPGGSTFLFGGWFTGCEKVAEKQLPNGLNRTLLLTDGQANVGIVDPIELGVHASQLKERQISTTTIGVGLDFDHFLLERMSELGGGNYYFIENPQSIPEIFQKELHELVNVSARAVEVIIPLPKNVNAEVLGGWPTNLDVQGLHIKLGDLASDQQKFVYLKLALPATDSVAGLDISAKVFARDDEDGLLEKQADVQLNSVPQAEVELSPEDKELMSRFAIVDNAEAANEALKLERAGYRDQAGTLLQRHISANAPYTKIDELKEYQGLSQRMHKGLEELDRKRSNYDANFRRKIRDS
jgi:Ca-activated chloride channel family protein